MLEPGRREELLKDLLDASDGTRADDYATLLTEFGDMQAELDKQAAEITKITDANTALKRENFRLFERVGIHKEDEVIDTSVELVGEDPKDYLKDVMDEKGFFK